jgi:hypothetical protein
MAYNIIKSDGTLLTTIADGTINTSSSSVGLPGRNFAGYGQTLDTNFVWLTENFAANTPPVNALVGQLWYNTNANTLYVCPTDGEANANAWLALAQSGGSGTTTFGNITANNITANNVTTSNTVSGLNGEFTNISVTTSANIGGTLTIGTANVTTLNTRIITTGANTTTGTITGTWSLTTGSRLNATYADLAERFEADAYYDAGTVVEMGGEKEITAVQHDLSDDVFGVVSDSAAYLMNSAAGDDVTHPPIAVGGRVKVKVTGKVKKGDRLVSAGNGIARAAQIGEATAFNIIGRSLENKTSDNVGIVEAFVKIN